MEIKIEKQPLITAKLNLNDFKQDLVVFDGESKRVANLDLKKAFMNNLRITKIMEGVDLKEGVAIKNLIFLGIDWGGFLRHFLKSGEDETTIYLTSCVVSGMKRYTPGTLDMGKGVFTCDEIIEVDSTGNKTNSTFSTFYIAHTFLQMSEYHIEQMLSQHLFNYTEKGWTKID